jgi:hypothetical protein
LAVFSRRRKVSYFWNYKEREYVGLDIFLGDLGQPSGAITIHVHGEVKD